MNSKTISCFSGFLVSILLLVAINASAQLKEEPSSLFMLNASQVHPTVVKSFEQKFKNATVVSWYQAKENNVLVKYSQNAQTQYALFKANGNLIRQFTYGTERNLPIEIKNVFKGRYWKGTVVNVANVKEASRNIWIIYAEQDNHPFAVKIEDGEVEEL